MQETDMLKKIERSKQHCQFNSMLKKIKDNLIKAAGD